MSRKIPFAFLLLAGILLFGIGAALLLAPHAFYASNGIPLGSDPNLLSETRAPGGLLVASAAFILFGAFRRNLRSLAMMVAAVVYGSFGLARLLSVALDGTPSEKILAATAIELVFAVIGLGFWLSWIPGRARVADKDVGPRDAAPTNSAA